MNTPPDAPTRPEVATIRAWASGFARGQATESKFRIPVAVPLGVGRSYMSKDRPKCVTGRVCIAAKQKLPAGPLSGRAASWARSDATVLGRMVTVRPASRPPPEIAKVAGNAAVPRVGGIFAGSTCATVSHMSREITQRELRNNSGEIMRALDGGESFVVTRNGVPVGELAPLRRRRFVAADAAIAAFVGAPRLEDLRSDLDAVLDQDPEPRA